MALNITGVSLVVFGLEMQCSFVSLPSGTQGCEGPAGTQERRVWGCARCGWSAQGVPCEVPTHHEMRRGAADAERERDALPSERVCVKLG